MRKYLLFCLAFCVLGCLAQDLIVRPNDPIIYKKEGGAFLWLGDMVRASQVWLNL